MLFFIILTLLVAALLFALTLPQLQGWRSMIFHTGTVIVGGAIPMLSQQVDFLKTVDWTQLITNKSQLSLVVIALGVVGIILRWLTTSPVGEKPGA